MIVDVCVCTFRRPSLRNTLKSLASQIVADDVQVHVIIADNDTTPSARALVEQASIELDLRCTYVHAPARNISIARNACLDAAIAPIGGFIDDDEVADPHWLAGLLTELRLGACDIVFGPVRARYAADAPRWAKLADLHSIRPVIRAGGKIETGYTSNVLFRRAAIGAMRFDIALGRTGGEDTCFFAALHAAGVRLGYNPTAVVYEDVAAGRTRLPWLLRRAFRSGQVHGRVQAARVTGRKLPLAIASAKALYCVLGAGLRAGSAPGWRRYLVRAALHAGVMAKLLGVRELELY